ncbi:hypothetical protein HALO153_130074 [Vreelandella titanicae]|nr:hypothetical protein HALO153_130074 [Halomonas titanicae]
MSHPWQLPYWAVFSRLSQTILGDSSAKYSRLNADFITAQSSKNTLNREVM